MERILNFIDQNYDSVISKIEIENIVHYSHRNNQRLFKRFFGETIRSFQQRLKLENAYKKLVYSTDSITSIAFDVGYETPSSFNKAFKKHYNLSPTQARQNKNILFFSFIEKYIQGVERDIGLEVVQKEEETVFYKTILTNDYSNTEINTFWDVLRKEYLALPDSNFFGLILDQPLISIKNKNRYQACFSANLLNSALFSKTIFGGKYLKIRHLGSYEFIEMTYAKVYYKWLITLDYEIGNSPIIEHYVVGRESVQNEEELITDIYFPIL